MFGSAIEPLLVRAPMGLVHLAMKVPVRTVVTSVSIKVVVMRECCSGWCRYGQHRHSNESFAQSHNTSPVGALDRSAGRLHAALQCGGEIEPHRNEPFRNRSWPAAKVELPWHLLGGTNQKRLRGGLRLSSHNAFLFGSFSLHL